MIDYTNNNNNNKEIAVKDVCVAERVSMPCPGTPGPGLTTISSLDSHHEMITSHDLSSSSSHREVSKDVCITPDGSSLRVTEEERRSLQPDLVRYYHLFILKLIF